MGELPKQLLAWIAKLLPKQKVQGNGAIQVGKVSGNVTIVHVTHAPDSQVSKAPSLTTPEQREVLGMIRKLKNREAVFSWMQKSFGTRMVMDLKPSEVLRARRYIETINRRMNKEKLG
ncbi:hypothetical protein LJR074_004008 [Acidovorax sp. LjRoot74]|uniref:hypothetical protein n=1 Tax=Acidovorax sp. LjRoot74 TaxID=3342337 RepID=UPI003ECFF778